MILLWLVKLLDQQPKNEKWRGKDAMRAKRRIKQQWKGIYSTTVMALEKKKQRVMLQERQIRV